MSQRRRRNYVKRPNSQVAIATAIIGGVCLLLFFSFISLTVLGQGFASKWMAGLGVISAFVCLFAFIKSLEPFRDVAFDTLNRWIGMLLPFLGFAAWTVTYFVGIILG